MKVHEVIKQDDLPYCNEIFMFWICKLCATLFRELLLYMFPCLNTDRFHIIGIQINIVIAIFCNLYYYQYCNVLLGCIVMVSLDHVKSLTSFYFWLILYSVWNIIFTWYIDNVLQGILHNVLPIYHLICATGEYKRNYIKTWTNVRCLCLSCLTMNRCIAFYNSNYI